MEDKEYFLEKAKLSCEYICSAKNFEVFKTFPSGREIKLTLLWKGYCIYLQRLPVTKELFLQNLDKGNYIEENGFNSETSISTRLITVKCPFVFEVELNRIGKSNDLTLYQIGCGSDVFISENMHYKCSLQFTEVPSGE